MKFRPLLIAFYLAMAGAGLSFPEAALSGSISPLNTTQDLLTALDWGGEHHRVEGKTSNGKVILHYVQFDPDRLEPAIALPTGGIGSLSPLEEMMQKTGAVVGINANFFDPKSNAPIGFLLSNGNVLNAPYSDRATLTVEFFGRIHFSNPKVSLYLQTANKRIPLQGINRPLSDHALIFYTPEYNNLAVSWKDALVIAVRRDQVLWKGTGRVPASLVSKDVSWLIATGSARKHIEALSSGDSVEIEYSMSPERFFVRDAIQAGPMLLRSGKNTLLRPEGFKPEFIQMRAARSAIGITATGQLILLVVTKGNGSVGMSLDQVASYLRYLGAVDAMALDGGSSSSLAFQQGEKLRNVGGSRGIPVGLVFLPR